MPEKADFLKTNPALALRPGFLLAAGVGREF
jgi:hypothetical protein